MTPGAPPAKLTRADLTRHPHLAALVSKPPAAPGAAAPPARAPPTVPQAPPPLAPGIPFWERAEILAHGAMLGMIAAGLMRIMLGVWT